ncbi:MAG: ArsA-related P-loop ATPase, partial [Pseudobdellovibrionaceae bacterium]
GYEPQNIAPGLDVCLWKGEDCLKEYARHLLKLESLYQIFFENQVMRTFINIAPGLSELSIMGKVTSGPRKHGPQMPYGKIFMDSYATGHFLALLRAPAALAKTVQFGPMGEQSRNIDKILKNPEICDYVIVAIPEELPVQEAIDLYDALKQELGFAPKLILNRCLLQENEINDLQSFDQSSDEWKPYFQFLQGHWQRQQSAIETLQNHLKKSGAKKSDLIRLPFLLSEQSMSMIQTLANDLSSELKRL